MRRPDRIVRTAADVRESVGALSALSPDQIQRVMKAMDKIKREPWLQRVGLTTYVDTRDWWIGYCRGPNHHYVCPLPTLVIRWRA
jgi:hypothetical protein